MRENPGDSLVLMLKKVRRFWGAYEIPDSLDYLLYAEYAPLLRVPLPGFGLLAPLSLTGFVLAARRRGWPRLLLVWTALYAATVIVFFVFSRFRMVIAPALYVLAAYAGVELFGRFKAWRGGTGSLESILVPSLAFLIFFGFVNIPVRARVDSWSYRIADATGLPTWPQTSAQGHFNLGVALAQEAKDATDAARADAYLGQAEQHLQRTIDLRGEGAFAIDYAELGKVLARSERNSEAIAAYMQAERIEPRDYRNPHAIGILHARAGDTPRSVEAFSRALNLDPRRLASANRLGEGLLELGRYEEARDVFAHALRIDAGSARAAEGMRRAVQGGG
jgi:tetratricopeptide (TPR) repeat protein